MTCSSQTRFTEDFKTDTLLNTVRKVLLIITLHRTRRQIESYLPKSQSDFGQSGKHQMWYGHINGLPRKSMLKKLKLRSYGSQALPCPQHLDSLDRTALLDIVKTIIVSEGEHRVNRVLPSNIVVNTRVHGATEW